MLLTRKYGFFFRRKHAHLKKIMSRFQHYASKHLDDVMPTLVRGCGDRHVPEFKSQSRISYRYKIMIQTIQSRKGKEEVKF